MTDEDIKELNERFQLICRKCGSLNIVVDIEEAYFYSEDTQDLGSITIGCNGCKTNDLWLSL
jgi:hypothetical protein